ncbi:hypothetical protein [Amycolatopsis sp. BJA-103]|uniref:hypothetical protein n=1 Tax=Amycolatopsis sp. BJA-103 TaxID=1911175 RepID=UPI0011AEF9AB|nr:hypothetical protein [Amycolatopsis sp. BJA-103]
MTGLLGVRDRLGVFSLPEAIVDVSRNPGRGATGDFIGWPAIVEVEAEEGAERASVVGLVSRILSALWEAGIPAVAACDYEDELPWRGGIGRLET